MFQPEKDFEEYGMFVFKYLMSLCGNADLAEELTQETFYRAIRSSGKFDGSCKVSTWLCQIAKHIWYQELDRRRRKKTEPLQENGTGDGLENDYCRKEQTMEVMKAVHILEESGKEVFLLRITGGFSFKEIGEICGRNENWARVTFYRAKQRIMKEVGGERGKQSGDYGTRCGMCALQGNFGANAGGGAGEGTEGKTKNQPVSEV